MRHQGRKRRPRQGFTLTEMLIVLAILVALAALVIPRFLGTQKKADIQTTKAQIGSFKGALNAYALDNRTFPTTEQGLQALLAPPAESEEGASASGWKGPYLQTDSLPKDAWGNDYRYVYPPEHTTVDFPDIWSAGPDGQDNTEDDICSWTVSREGEGEMGTEKPEDLDVDVDVDVSVPTPGGPGPGGRGPGRPGGAPAGPAGPGGPPTF